MQVQLLSETGEALDDDVHVTPVANVAHSIFNDAQVFLNENLVSDSNKCYHYLAYMMNTLSYSQLCKTGSWMETELYAGDSSGAMDRTSPLTAPINSGLGYRYKKFRNSQTVDLIFRPMCPLFLQPRYLCPNVDLRLKLLRNSQDFLLMVEEPTRRYMLKIQNIVMMVRTVKVNDSILQAHKSALNRNVTLKYPVVQTQLQSFAIPAGTFSHHRGTLASGRLPRRIVFAFTTNESFNGSPQLNGFNMQHFNIRSIQLRQNGICFPQQPLETYFTDSVDTSRVAQAYDTLYSQLDRKYRDSSIGISMADYIKGYCFMVFKLQEGFSDVSYQGLQTTGNIQLEIKFDKSLAKTIPAIVLMEYSGLVEIASGGEIRTDYMI